MKCRDCGKVTGGTKRCQSCADKLERRVCRDCECDLNLKKGPIANSCYKCYYRRRRAGIDYKDKSKYETRCKDCGNEKERHYHTRCKECAERRRERLNSKENTSDGIERKESRLNVKRKPADVIETYELNYKEWEIVRKLINRYKFGRNTSVDNFMVIHYYLMTTKEPISKYDRLGPTKQIELMLKDLKKYYEIWRGETQLFNI